ncbi:MAG: glycosyltransferase family 4 protein [Chloroflexi bacterium]|nr:glycosyltransferase family 4 protein [Chloroflexota bacterium]
MKILLVNQAFVSFDEPGFTRHFEMAQYIRERGHEMVIVASDVNYQTGARIVDGNGFIIEQTIEGVRVLRGFMLPSLHRNYFWRIVSFLGFMFSAVAASLRVKDADLVIGSSPPIFQAFAAWFASFLLRKPFLFEVRDLWPQFAIDMKVIKNPVIIFITHALEKFLYNRAARILVNSPAYKPYIVSRGVPAEKITFIPYGADVSIFTPDADGSSVRRELGLDDKFIVLYAGAMGQANDIYTILRAADRLRDDAKIHFVLYGDGKENANLRAEADRLRLPNLTFAGAAPKTKMPAVVAASDLCLAILQDIPGFRMTYPNKVFDHMAAGRATALVIDGVIRDVIEASGGGVYIPPADDARLAQVIRELAHDPARLRQMGQQARDYLVKNFDRRDKLAETLELFKFVAKESENSAFGDNS